LIGINLADYQWEIGRYMTRQTILLVAVLAAALAALPVFAQQAELQCMAGPVKKTYGNTPWLVYGCNDGQSIMIVTAPGSPAAPFYFIFSGGHLRGEGTGNKAATDAAYNDLQRLTDQDIKTLVLQTKNVKSTGANGSATDK
jgi:hypothetical protein